RVARAASPAARCLSRIRVARVPKGGQSSRRHAPKSGGDTPETRAFIAVVFSAGTGAASRFNTQINTPASTSTRANSNRLTSIWFGRLRSRVEGYAASGEGTDGSG